jgi:hypothetical protein
MVRTNQTMLVPQVASWGWAGQGGARHSRGGRPHGPHKPDEAGPSGRHLGLGVGWAGLGWAGTGWDGTGQARLGLKPSSMHATVTIETLMCR